MHVYHFPEGPGVGQYLMLASDLISSPLVHTGEWQAMNTTGSPAHATHELEDVSIVWDRMPDDLRTIVPAIDYAWADEHFAERIGGRPLNPAPSHLSWPYAVAGNAMHTDASKRFDHTYPERFWPTYAGLGNAPVPPVFDGNLHKGIRFRYGDLSDVVDLLARSPLTRQAFLPVWFPEDTGAHHGQRVPCTIGYHFMQRGGRLTCRYYLRSCEIYRHMSNDIYLAAKLTRWICDAVYNQTQDNGQAIHMRPGGLLMHISSLHAFSGDVPRIKQRIEDVSKNYDDEVHGQPV